MEWALSTGLGLIWGCRDPVCSPIPMSNIRQSLIEADVDVDVSKH